MFKKKEGHFKISYTLLHTDLCKKRDTWQKKSLFLLQNKGCPSKRGTVNKYGIHHPPVNRPPLWLWYFNWTSDLYWKIKTEYCPHMTHSLWSCRFMSYLCLWGWKKKKKKKQTVKWLWEKKADCKVAVYEPQIYKRDPRNCAILFRYGTQIGDFSQRDLSGA